MSVYKSLVSAFSKGNDIVLYWLVYIPASITSTIGIYLWVVCLCRILGIAKI